MRCALSATRSSSVAQSIDRRPLASSQPDAAASVESSEIAWSSSALMMPSLFPRRSASASGSNAIAVASVPEVKMSSGRTSYYAKRTSSCGMVRRTTRAGSVVTVNAAARERPIIIL